MRWRGGRSPVNRRSSCSTGAWSCRTPTPSATPSETSFLTCRNYDAESERKKTVEEFYRVNHNNQTYGFVARMWAEYGRLDKTEMSVWECMELLNEFIDDSDPDLDMPQIEHLLQTAEAIRKDYPDEDWLHLTGLIHDLESFLGGQSLVTPSPWAARTTSATFTSSTSRRTLTTTTPGSTPSSGPTPRAAASTTCSCHGAMTITCTWWPGRTRKSTLPSAGLFIIRYHSFYRRLLILLCGQVQKVFFLNKRIQRSLVSLLKFFMHFRCGSALHNHGAYMHLMNDEDKENLKWLHVFNFCSKYDLYSKSNVRIDVEKVKPYYMSLVDKYFPAKMRW
ncbi:probable inositol oxygenase isoform X2 [Phragmites australis]|uniref:probable inositol oxygenase isoform X2 n=1 Tax=Phragmites australis TaxID=29695 RepID=UPI002D778A20|nr:probable inositol oxygenase isoform X2 [Phragmites australis]